ncbi:DNA polymerase III subunit gamma/tau [Salinicola halophyticus]|uniref:DNA polymerase III subunit gamma/tau n=1 Tax=Salinicola halophyticus TaxID=1808881 RepID=UPI003F4688A1
MSYQVLARKWRPRTFHELVGQEHVSRALVNALDQGRLHHAYLFTGTRGVGKTTLARILAKCLNCEQGVTSKPCGQCQTCRDIDSGRFVDLIEVDAASRTKVEDTRELLDNVQYAPTQGRYKVYLIDEVHMLSTHSFNALLKTLEEPPPHVKFLLATTDPQKLPVTVLSRCLQFTLKNMPPERVVEHLTRVLEAEQVAFDPQALWLLGKAADGSMRDAMSLTDQAIAFGDGEVRREDVAAMLGTLDHAHLIALAQALADVDAERLLAEVAALAEQGPDFAGVLDELSGLMHRLAIAQMVPGALDNGHGDRDELLALAGRFTAEDVQLYYQIALQGRGDIDNAPDTRSALEMTLLRMLAFRPQGVPTPPQTDLPLRGSQHAGGQPEVARQTASQPAPGHQEMNRPEVAPSAVDQSEGDSSEGAGSEGARSEGARSEGGPSETGQSRPGQREEIETATGQVEESVQAEDQVEQSVAPAQSATNDSPPAMDDRPPWATDVEPVEVRREGVSALETPVSPAARGPESASSDAPSGDSVDAADRVDDDHDDDGAGNIKTKSDFATETEFDSNANFDDGDNSDNGASVDSDAYAWAERADSLSHAAPAPQTELAPLPPTSNDEVEATPQLASAVDEREPITQTAAAAATEPLDHARWLAQFDQLDIGGLTRNLAAHCVVDSDDGSVLRITLDPGQSAMLSELHVERIRKALAGLGYVRRLEIDVAELDGARETAKAKRDRESRERHLRAVEALRGDPHIQELEARFGARLIEESVTTARV